ncbi:hypothetical protein CDL15_Pgr001395 [Punica granatum]|uniref:VQ domain-containing protein n=1 Tax=Punica granatum TaxID=22663 RepID=A0A218WM04_PUNGR|nr:hypothetical protein CDL15_Pgr001395 [Punica granatum]PKI55710.1 hypothetical protein CRG98_023926 [Punica granatum]
MGLKKMTINDGSHTSFKISEHNNVEKIKKKIIKRQQQPPINSLIKVLRPRVYITDSSAFKSLVQQLTGNGVPGMPPVDADIPVAPASKAPVVDIGTVMRELEEMVSPSFHDYSSPSGHLASLDESSPCPSDDHSSYNSQQEADHHDHQMMLSDSPVDESLSFLFGDLDMTMTENLFSYHDLESWLLDLEPPEVSVYDYPLTGLF